MISHEHKAIMIHVPKTGGTSIEFAFGFINIDKPEDFVRRSGLADTDRMGPKHAKSRRLRRMYPDLWKQYFTFAFVRNPWDRLVSSFFWARQGNNPRLLEYEDFPHFVRDLPNLDRSEDSQWSYVSGRQGKQQVEYIGYYERLAEDFDYVCERLGVTLELPHLNASKRRDYRDYYDDETREIVRAVYKDDVEKFGYRFGEPAPESIKATKAKS
jgi:hypothetical protein